MTRCLEGQSDSCGLVGGAEEEGGEEGGREVSGRGKRVGWEGCMQPYQHECVTRMPRWEGGGPCGMGGGKRVRRGERGENGGGKGG